MRAVEKVKEEELFEVESEYIYICCCEDCTDNVCCCEDCTDIGGLVEEISLQSGSLERVFPYSLCAFECMFCLLPVYSIQLRKERMWGSYHHLRSAETFVHDWQKFLSVSVKM